MKQYAFVGLTVLLAVPAQAADLSGFYTITQTPYQSQAQKYRLELVSGGAFGIYDDQGSAYMLSFSQRRFRYVGQYQLYSKHLSIVLGNYGQYARDWFVMSADLQENQWTKGLCYDYAIAGKKTTSRLSTAPSPPRRIWRTAGSPDRGRVLNHGYHECLVSRYRKRGGRLEPKPA
jgi:hypothetical protein